MPMSHFSTRRATAVFAAIALSLAATAFTGSSPALGAPGVKNPGKACDALQETAPNAPGKALRRGTVADLGFVHAMCQSSQGIVYHETCTDGIDNDFNGLIDLNDPKCLDGGPEEG
jgi:hypothetical protein